MSWNVIAYNEESTSEIVASRNHLDYETAMELSTLWEDEYFIVIPYEDIPDVEDYFLNDLSVEAELCF